MVHFGYTPTEHSPETEKVSQLSSLSHFEALIGAGLDLLGHLGNKMAVYDKDPLPLTRVSES